MKFIADLHVHSKFSRATAKNLDLENLYIAAQIKGVTIVGTGDFTHPEWFSEIKKKLVPAESGLFKLKHDLTKICDQQVPLSCRSDVRFVLTTEISNIYKKNGKTRKNHNLVLVPGMEVAEEFSIKLDQIGNIKSDGRPILGLDARDLLEILLETSDQAFLIPAHIWTPWFSILGSKSGFDSIEECFEDLTSHIFAVETGLSSDPPMNWRISGLDGLTLVSNSDAHSPLNIGREANLFNTHLSYPAVKSAIQTGDPEKFLGTYEFYPEEGKYHLDGHRKCKVSLRPQRTMAHKGICPVCKKPLTLGVLNRIEELANRHDGQKPQNTHPYYSMIPLVDILAEIMRVGTQSKKVKRSYQTAIKNLGPEFDILHILGLETIEKAGIPLLCEAIQRMRQKEIKVIPGYDGEYGRVKIFSAQEREQFLGQKSLFFIPVQNSTIKKEAQIAALSKNQIADEPSKTWQPEWVEACCAKKPTDIFKQLNEEQRRAVEYPGGPLMIVAGPGTGKTRTLTHRIAYLINKKGVSPQNILAVTFTHKAVQEMRERLETLLIGGNPLPFVSTFHSLCFKILNDLKKDKVELIIDDGDRKAMVAEALKQVQKKGSRVYLKLQTLLNRIIAAKQQIMGPDDIQNMPWANESENEIFLNVYQAYQHLLSIQGLNDYEDLIFKIVILFETDQEVCRTYQNIFKHIFVDEFQDLNQAQYRIIRALAPPEHSNSDVCVIGDPDQSIYGFRGSDIKLFNRFVADYPDTPVIRLTRNYRSTKTILDASCQIINAHRVDSFLTRTYSQIEGVKTISILELADEKTEAETVAATIEKMVGGTGFHSIDTGKVDDANLLKACSYSDFAVFYRTNEQNRIIAEIFEQAGIPFQIASRENVLNQFRLPELISLLKVVEGCGSYTDYEKIILFFLPAFNKKDLVLFKNWCYRQRLSLQEAQAKAMWFPLPGFNTSGQQRLNDFGEHLLGLAKKISGMTVADKLHVLIEDSGLFTNLNDLKFKDAINKLVELSRSSGTSTADFSAMAALHTDTDAYAPRVEKVSLMTMHAAKGLEFPVVFITGCEQGYIPFKRSNDDPADIAEERRLFYVAMTRSKDRLHLTRAKKRRIYGKLESRNLSPFVADIETHLKKNASPQLKKKKVKEEKQLKLF